MPAPGARKALAIRVALVVAAALLAGTCAALPSSNSGFLGAPSTVLTAMLVATLVSSSVVGLSVLLADGAPVPRGSWSLGFLRWLGAVAAVAALTPCVFYLLAPGIGLWSLILSPPGAVLLFAGWTSLTRRWSVGRIEASPSRWTLSRGMLVIAGAVLVLGEFMPHVSQAVRGERLINAVAARLRFENAVPALTVARWAVLAVIGTLGFIWGLPSRSLGAGVRGAVIMARLSVVILLTLPFSVALTDNVSLDAMARVMPDALALVGAWALLHESWDAKRRSLLEPTSESISALGGSTP